MKIALLGDIALNGLFVLEHGKNKERFQEVVPILQNCDLVFANLETPLRGNGEINENKREGRGVIHYSDLTAFNEVLLLLNLSVVSLANNHIYDFKKSGAKETIEKLEELNIKHIGAGLEKKEIEPLIIERDSYRIGFLAYVDENTNPLIPKNADIFINFFDEKKIIEDINLIKEECDFIILSLHWGIDYSFYPTKYQRKVSRKFINAGADIIMGHHTHTLQPFERYKKGIIFYNLGTFCHGDFLKGGELRSLHLKSRRSIIVNIDLKDKNFNIIPIKTEKYNFIKIDKKVDTNRLNQKRLNTTKLIHTNFFIHKLYFIKELVFDKIIDYFFGYYKNPIRQLLSFSYIIKFNNYIKDCLCKFKRQT